MIHWHKLIHRVPWSSTCRPVQSLPVTLAEGYLGRRASSSKFTLVRHDQCRRWFGNTTQPLSPYKVAIVGSGPAGCYTAKYLQSALDKKAAETNDDGGADVGASSSPADESAVTLIDVLERHATIGGLVRYGVAPDHPEVKNVLHDFEVLFDEKGIRFFGNVNVGTDVTVEELRSLYDVVVLAYGCQSDNKLGIPGEDLSGVMSAREFVAWYNGHPDYVHIGEKVAELLGSKEKGTVRDVSVVILGQGNVALDCARILAKGTNGLNDTDIISDSLPVIGNGVSRISIVGRRGHVQGAFTIKEVRELVKLGSEGHMASFHVFEDELDLGSNDASLEELSKSRPKKRIEALLRDAAASSQNGDDSFPKTVELRFLMSPVRFEPSHSDPGKLGSVIFERTRLEGEPGSQKAVGTGEMHSFPAELALVSIGYKGTSLGGIEQQFDEKRGTVIHEHGRMSSPSDAAGGLYASGWLKRGPSGIIGTNIADAKETVSSITHDLESYQPGRREGDLSQLLRSRGVKFVDWDGYRRIDQYEKTHKRTEHQPREKLVDPQKQLEIALK